MVSRLRGEAPELADALPPPERFRWDTSWLKFSGANLGQASVAEGQWFVEGKGNREQRGYFFALLQDTAEILWTNGAGVKLGLQPWAEFQRARASGDLRPLPRLTPFGQVLNETVTVLAGVSEKQRRLRENAAQEARNQADALRRKREQEDLKREREEAAREAELRRERQRLEEQRQDDDRAERERLAREQRLLARKQVHGLKLGGWIVVSPSMPEEEPIRLKLAVRINASRKLVFVDRLGLNRREFLEDNLVEDIVVGWIRVLGSSAEFDDTLSRVVGRIRVDRN